MGCLLLLQEILRCTTRRTSRSRWRCVRRCRGVAPLGNDRSGRDERMGFHHRSVHDHRAHAYQRVVAQGASVHHGVVGDGYVVADVERVFFVRGVQGGVVLDIDLVAHLDVVHVSAHDGPEPNVAVFAHGYVAQDGGVVGKPAAPSPYGRFAPYFFDDSHFLFRFYARFVPADPARKHSGQLSLPFSHVRCCIRWMPGRERDFKCTA